MPAADGPVTLINNSAFATTGYPPASCKQSGRVDPVTHSPLPCGGSSGLYVDAKFGMNFTEFPELGHNNTKTHDSPAFAPSLAPAGSDKPPWHVQLNDSKVHALPPVPPLPVRCVAPSPFSTQSSGKPCKLSSKTTDESAMPMHNDRAKAPNNLRFLSFYGNGNAEEVTAADRAALVNAHANLIATNNLTVCKQAWHAEKLRCMLTVDWVWTHSPAALNASLVTEAAPLISSGGLAVLFLGDEPHVGSEANLARVANAARASLNSIAGGSSVLIYMNHCGSGLKR